MNLKNVVFIKNVSYTRFHKYQIFYGGYVG
ncbi:hypothetical protein PEC331060_01070 [Pectobacterium carotovorum subsp. carotovorum]|nr:hypothetical protein PEC331060_01070 [Pectobacterium carotovorum subsp. carotovorum]